MWGRSLVALVLLITCISGAPTLQAAETPVRHYLLSCKSTPLIECIEYITAVGKNGIRATAIEPSRTFQTGGDLNAIDIREEWSFQGFTFEGSAANRIVPRFVFRPLGSEQCSFGICIDGIEELQIGLEASWLQVTPDEEKTMQMDLSRRGSQLLCGELNSPRTCRRSFNFNQDMSFDVGLRLPVDFEPSAILGSVKNLSYVRNPKIQLIGGKQYRQTILKFDSQKLQKVLFSNFVPRPMETSDYADFEGDAINFWLLGSRSSQVTSLGSCATTPFITVLSNSVYQSLPRWNPISNSIEVDLQAPHFGVDASLHKGYFEATISKEMGSCLWGIDLGTKSVATMSITYSGESGQEVQTLSGRFDGNNYILFAANFHYSSPKISLRMQDAQPLPVKTADAKIKSIKCVKGKVTKVVKGQNPKCPAGYKVK